ADRLARAALANNPGRFSITGAVDVERLETLESALELFSDHDSATRAELLAVLAVELRWSPDWRRRHKLAEEAVSMGRRGGDPATLVRVLGRSFHAMRTARTHELCLRYAEEALALTEKRSDPWLRGLALDRAMWALLEVGKLDQFDRLLAEQRELVDRLSEPALRFAAALLHTTRALITANPTEAQRVVDDLIELDKQTRSERATTWGTLLGVLALRRGELREFLPAIELASHDFPDMPAVNAALANTHCELGQAEEARALLDQAAVHRFQDLPQDDIWLGAIALWASTAVGLAARDRAAVLYDELEPFSDLGVAPIH